MISFPLGVSFRLFQLSWCGNLGLEQEHQIWLCSWSVLNPRRRGLDTDTLTSLGTKSQAMPSLSLALHTEARLCYVYGHRFHLLIHSTGLNVQLATSTSLPLLWAPSSFVQKSVLPCIVPQWSHTMWHQAGGLIPQRQMAERSGVRATELFSRTSMSRHDAGGKHLATACPGTKCMRMWSRKVERWVN